MTLTYQANETTYVIAQPALDQHCTRLVSLPRPLINKHAMVQHSPPVVKHLLRAQAAFPARN